MTPSIFSTKCTNEPWVAILISITEANNLTALLFLLAVWTFLSGPELTTFISWYQITWLWTSTLQMSAILLKWKSDESPLSASTWLLKQPQLSSVPLFSQSQTTVILFDLAAHCTFQADHRKFRPLKGSWLSKHTNVIMCKLSFKLFTGYQSRSE